MGQGTTDWFQIGKGVRQGCILSPCLFNLHAEYIMQNAGVNESQAGIKIVVQSISCVWLFVTSWTAAHQASLSFTISQSLLKLMSTESVILSNHLILCRSLFLLPSSFSSIRVFPNVSFLLIEWPKYWSFSFSLNPLDEYQYWFPLGLTGLVLLSKGFPRIFSSPTVWKYQFFSA